MRTHSCLHMRRHIRQYMRLYICMYTRRHMCQHMRMQTACTCAGMFASTWRDVGELTATVEVHHVVLYLRQLVEAASNGRDVSEQAPVSDCGTVAVRRHVGVTGWNRRSLRSTAHRWCDAWFSLRTARESRLFHRYALTVADIHSRSSRQLHVEVRILADISLNCRDD